jgi:hypothetical protein
MVLKRVAVRPEEIGEFGEHPGQELGIPVWETPIRSWSPLVTVTGL